MRSAGGVTESGVNDDAAVFVDDDPTLSVAEAAKLLRRDRTRVYRIAAGSAAESLAALEVAVAWGHVDDSVVADARATLDLVLKLLWPLTK